MELLPLGDAALLVRFGDAIDDAISARVLAAAAHLSADPLPGVLEIVPAYATLAVHYDPAAVAALHPGESPRNTVGVWARRRLRDAPVGSAENSPIVEIPVCYGGEHGPDLTHVAERAGLGADEAAALHASGSYRVAMLGFMPGFPYLLGLPRRLATPRRDSPRVEVPAGSVGIAGAQTGVYPLDSPGGWQLIGRTPLRLFDASAEPPTLLSPGDRVRFRPIDAEEYEGLRAGTTR